MCFGDYLPIRTHCDAYHKEHASQLSMHFWAYLQHSCLHVYLNQRRKKWDSCLQPDANTRGVSIEEFLSTCKMIKIVLLLFVVCTECISKMIT